jgi:hypothetical protein
VKRLRFPVEFFALVSRSPLRHTRDDVVHGALSECVDVTAGGLP